MFAADYSLNLDDSIHIPDPLANLSIYDVDPLSIDLDSISQKTQITTKSAVSTTAPKRDIEANSVKNSINAAPIEQSFVFPEDELKRAADAMDQSFFNESAFGENFQWNGLDNLLNSKPTEHDAFDTRISVFERVDLDKLKDDQLFDAEDSRISFYIGKTSPPKVNKSFFQPQKGVKRVPGVENSATAAAAMNNAILPRANQTNVLKSAATTNPKLASSSAILPRRGEAVSSTQRTVPTTTTTANSSLNNSTKSVAPTNNENVASVMIPSSSNIKSPAISRMVSSGPVKTVTPKKDIVQNTTVASPRHSIATSKPVTGSPRTKTVPQQSSTNINPVKTVTPSVSQSTLVKRVGIPAPTTVSSSASTATASLNSNIPPKPVIAANSTANTQSTTGSAIPGIRKMVAPKKASEIPKVSSTKIPLSSVVPQTLAEDTIVNNPMDARVRELERSVDILKKDQEEKSTRIKHLEDLVAQLFLAMREKDLI